ncbi:MAG: quinone-interacting membrane-bound oxidoreductase complex subunit QmoC [bacterium]
MSNLIKPDIKFIKEIIASGGESLKRCYQCATCSVKCSLSGDKDPFPRKEMIKAQWGMKKELLASPDIWLCHQCRDCTTYCPRGAKPSEVLSAIRRLTIVHYGFPGFLARLVNQPKFLPLLLLIPTLLLGFAILVREDIEKSLGISEQVSQKIVFASTTIFPHWLLNTFFASLSTLVFIALFVGVIRFWLAMKHADGNRRPAKGIVSSILTAIKNIIMHNNFAECSTERLRFLSHSSVFFGFIALSVVAIWVITAPINPLFQKGLVYPFNFFSPLKIIANLGGVAVIIGCLLMIYNRLKEDSTSTYFDWAFIGTLFCVVASGFATEFLHYVRIDELRYPVYFAHLVFVSMLLFYLPYSKFSHLIYRTVAMVYAEYSGRSSGVPGKPEDEEKVFTQNLGELAKKLDTDLQRMNTEEIFRH